MKKPELLAPAGDYACFQAALRAGADAVYIGGSRYGARAYAGNFSEEEVLSALEEAHFFGRKLYMTVNTLMKQEELEQLPVFLAPFYEAGLDGVIVQDVGALSLLHEVFPGLPLHASTQMTLADASGAEALRELGIVRVVPARELSLEELIALKKEGGMEIEVFIHGAMCYCYSGQCLFSSLLGGRSGNRGRCAQPCRQPYRISLDGRAGKECYPLSLKDMCTISLIPELMEAGIDSFKIEGRMKKPEYVAGVTGVYRRRIDACLANPGKAGAVPREDMELLSSLYIRSGISEGYYRKHNGREMVTLSQPGYAGCKEPLLEQIRSEIMGKELSLPVSMKAILRTGQPAILQVSTDESRVCKEGSMVQRAQNRPLSAEEVKKQLQKTGGSGFTVEKLELEMDEDIFLPVRALNELRRSALEQLRKLRLAAQMPFRPQPLSARQFSSPEAFSVEKPFSTPQVHVPQAPTAQTSVPELSGKGAVSCSFHVTVTTPGQLRSALRAEVSRIYIPVSSINKEMRSALEDIREKRPQLFLSLPVILRKETAGQMDFSGKLLDSGLFDGAQAASPSAFQWLASRGWEGGLALDHRMYLWNDRSWAFWKKKGMDTYCAPLELNRKNLFALPQEGKELLVYGRIPMMVTANCIRKTAGRCLLEQKGASGRENAFGKEEGSGSKTALIDRYQTEFPVVCDCRYCYNIIYNSVPLSLHTCLEELKSHGILTLRLDFLEESEKQTDKILSLFSRAAQGVQVQAEYAFTTGHYKKGAQ